MTDDQIAGTIKIGWSIDEKHLGIDHDRELTKGELMALYDRIEDLITSAFQTHVTIRFEGEDKPPVPVYLEVTDTEIEINDGPVSGLLSDLRRR